MRVAFFQVVLLAMASEAIKMPIQSSTGESEDDAILLAEANVNANVDAETMNSIYADCKGDVECINE